MHHPDTAPELLTGVEDRLELLAETGLDAVLLLEYTLDFARQTPEEFVVRYLVQGLRAATVVVGRDVRFGWGNAGDLATMTELGRQHVANDNGFLGTLQATYRMPLGANWRTSLGVETTWASIGAT